MPRRQPRNTTVSGNFTNTQDLIKSFLRITGARQQAKARGNNDYAGDAGYWEGGRCNWGGSHKLEEDAEQLANFFNSVADISNDINNIKLSANEQAFNSNKQQLVSKIQGLISKCQMTSYYSVASICCIWNDFFGIFLKKYLDNFSAKLRRNLTEVEKLEPKHQKELLDLEKEAREAESAYKENLEKANNETDPVKKAEFVVLANKASKKAQELKRRIKNNPLAQLASFNYLDDLRALINGNVPPNVTPDRTPSGGGSGDGGNNQTPNPLEDPKQFFEQNQMMIFIALAVLALFYLNSQNSNDYRRRNYYDY